MSTIVKPEQPDVYGKTHPDGLLKVEEVAQRLNCSPSFVYGLLTSGALRHFVLGQGQGGKRVSEEQLLDYLRKKERGGEDKPAAASPPPTPRLKHLSLD